MHDLFVPPWARLSRVIVVGILGATGGAVLEIASRGAATGARTEVVGAVPIGDSGDRLLLQLAAAGVGHATVTRSPASSPESASDPSESPIEPADLELALRYLPDVRAIILVAPTPALLATAAAASGFSGAALVVVGSVDAATLDALPAPQPIVLEPPSHDPDGAFAGLVAAFAVRLEAGEAPATAWTSTLATLAVEAVPREVD
ncbi:MAG TPA: hypothetical protein VGM49_08510 [Candidatus Limnocylindrales bacterium]